VFTAGICPTTDNISVRFIEWYYLITWMLLDLYFSLTFQKVSQQSQLLLQSAYKLSLHELRQNNNKLNDQSAKSQTSETYVTPLRRFFGQLPSLQKKDSNETIDGSDIMQLLAERQKKARRYYSIASWCGVALGMLLIAYYLFAIYYLFGHEQGLIQSILITICIILGCHFFFGGLSLTPIKLTRYQSLISRCFGMIYLVAILLAAVLSGDFLIYVAAYLWPISAVLIASDFSRNSPDKKVSLFNPDTVHYQKNHEAERKEISFIMQWSFFRFFALTCACGSFFISLFSGLYLPLTFTIVILVCSISISGYLPSNRFGYYSALSLFYIFVLGLAIILTIITPVYWGRSTSMISTSFVQKDHESLAYSSSFTDSQGLYLSFEAAKSKSDNHAALKYWLDSLPASQNRIYFDVRDDLVLVKKIGLVYCLIVNIRRFATKNMHFPPFSLQRAFL
jgi:MFS family permease